MCTNFGDARCGKPQTFEDEQKQANRAVETGFPQFPQPRRLLTIFLVSHMGFSLQDSSNFEFPVCRMLRLPTNVLEEDFIQ